MSNTESKVNEHLEYILQFDDPEEVRADSMLMEYGQYEGLLVTVEAVKESLCTALDVNLMLLDRGRLEVLTHNANLIHWLVDLIEAIQSDKRPHDVECILNDLPDFVLEHIFETSAPNQQHGATK